jgi:hypothetical protein
VTVDSAEELLWTVLRRFETDTMALYREHVPELALPAKSDLIERLRERAPSDVSLNASALAGPVEKVLVAARSEDAEETLFTQGILLELLGGAIYRAAAVSDQLREASRELAERGRGVCRASVAEAVRMITERIGEGDPAFEAFSAATHDVLAAVDALAEPVDRAFAEPFGVRYSDVLGECTADLVCTCQSLGMPRRKVAGHLAGASMGF